MSLRSRILLMLQLGPGGALALFRRPQGIAEAYT